jgi:ATP-dependent Clp protease adaptor protein ClpS
MPVDMNPVISPDILDDEHYIEDTEGPWVVILYNDDYHDMGEVAFQIQKATGCNLEKAIEVMLEAHTRGRAIAYTGSQDECERAANVLRAIRLQVETDRF